ncbi:MAG: four helix bundle protein [Anaerolineae bacterium]|nr:four helix bundle protein [Anaerolineae bacterium]
MGKYQELEEIEVYQLAVAVGDCLWEIVSSWSYFARDTVGKQMVRAADSIGANIAESYGRSPSRKLQRCTDQVQQALLRQVLIKVNTSAAFGKVPMTLLSRLIVRDQTLGRTQP